MNSASNGTGQTELTMITLLRQRNFAFLWFGQLVSILGDWVLFVALPFYVYNLTGSVLATGGMFVIRALPSVVFGSFAGVLVDRWDRKRTLITADLSRAALLPLLLTVHSLEGLWIIYLIAFVESTISVFFYPAKSAILPHLVAARSLMAANSLDAISTNLTRLIGPSLGGLLMGGVGLLGVVLVDTASYLISGVMITCISLSTDRAEERRVQSIAALRWMPLWRDWVAGLAFMQQERWLISLFVTNGLVMLAEGIINVLFVVFVQDVLQGGSMEFGWLMTVRGLGSLVGGFIAGYASTRLVPMHMMTLGAVATGLVFLAMFNASALPAVLVLFALSGVTWVPYAVSLQTQLQSGVIDHYRGRVFGAFGTMSALMLLSGAGLASALGDVLGIVPLFDSVAALYVGAGVVVLVMLRRRQGASQPVEGGNQVAD